MLSRHEGILFQVIPYSDRSVILKIFTREEGLQAFSFRKSSKQKTSGILQPLSLLEITSWKKNSQDIFSIREIQPVYTYRTIGSDYLKNAVILFLNEMLSQSVREPGMALENLFGFCKNWLIAFDQTTLQPLSHFRFLVKLTSYLGFAPVNNYSSQRLYFDLLAAHFVPAYSENAPLLDQKTSQLFHAIFFTEEPENISRGEKKLLANAIVSYFQVHVHGMKEIKSLPVLQELLD